MQSYAIDGFTPGDIVQCLWYKVYWAPSLMPSGPEAPLFTSRVGFQTAERESTPAMHGGWSFVIGPFDLLFLRKYENLGEAGRIDRAHLDSAPFPVFGTNGKAPMAHRLSHFIRQSTLDELLVQPAELADPDGDSAFSAVVQVRFRRRKHELLQTQTYELLKRFLSAILAFNRRREESSVSIQRVFESNGWADFHVLLGVKGGVGGFLELVRTVLLSDEPVEVLNGKMESSKLSLEIDHTVTYLVLAPGQAAALGQPCAEAVQPAPTKFTLMTTAKRFRLQSPQTTKPPWLPPFIELNFCSGINDCHIFWRFEEVEGSTDSARQVLATYFTYLQRLMCWYGFCDIHSSLEVTVGSSQSATQGVRF